MRGHIIVVAVTGLVASFGPAMADPAYRAEDIVRFFAPPPELGPTRGLCIGTEAECGQAVAKPAAKAAANASLDLLVTFDLNSDVLTSEAKENLNEFAKALRDSRLAPATFAVEGHTDARGSDAYNMSLSERRANAVVRYLSEQGVDRSRLFAKGFGEAKPRTADPLDAVNRRVETRLLPR